MSEQESQDLKELKSRIKEVKIACVDAQIIMLKMNPDDLYILTGHTIQSALERHLQDALKQIKSLTDDYLIKYSDK